MEVGDKVRFIDKPHYGEYTVTEKLHPLDPRVGDRWLEGPCCVIKRPGEERVVAETQIKRTCGGWNRMG